MTSILHGCIKRMANATVVLKSEDLDLNVLRRILTLRIFFWLVCGQDFAAGMCGKSKFDSKPVAGELSSEKTKGASA